ncbi:MFS transporter [Pseudomonas sp. CGJS7]|uniref:MFS transporter n=1 Tax=Pseudomonas sp. CGJS7 TaxID=3109348 RepID=UPI003007FDA3
MRAYLRLLATPGVARLLAAAMLSRVTNSMVSLALMLAVLRLRGSYVEAGAVLSAHALALAAFAPVGGRLADRLGARRVLVATLIMLALAYMALLAALHARAGTGVLMAAAALLGMSTPPAAPITRALWSRVVAQEQRRTIYALDSTLNSAMFVIGPLLAAALLLRLSPYAIIAVAGTSKWCGDALLASAPALRAMPSAPADRPAGPWLGPLGDARVRLLLTIIALDTFVYGSQQIGAAAVGGAGGAAGLLLGLVAAGEVIGGLALGVRPLPGGLRMQLVALHVATAALMLAAAAMPWMLAVAPLFLGAGLIGGARDTLNQLALSRYAPAAQRTEAFAWLATFMWGGYGIGTWVAGHAQQGSGTGAVFAAAACASALAAAGAACLRAPSDEDPDAVEVGARS